MSETYNLYNLEALFEEYLNAGNQKPISIKNYMSDFRHFAGWMTSKGEHGGSPLQEPITLNDISEYKSYLESNNIPHKTINRRLSTLRKFCSFCISQGWMKENPAKKISNISNVGNDPRVVPVEALTSPKLDELSFPRRWESKLKSLFKNVFSRLDPRLHGDDRESGNDKERGDDKKQNNDDQSQPISTNFSNFGFQQYIAFLIVLIFVSVMGAGIYNQFFVKNQASLAYPTALTKAGRILSFQGRLTDTLSNPITTATNVVFQLYSVSSGGTALYGTGTCSVTPDQDGIFSTLIGSDCGAEITSSVFSENVNVYLGVTVGGDAEMTPRQQIANVGYAINSETLQGLPPGTGTSVIPYINVDGNLLISASAPGIRSTSASTDFTLSSAKATVIQSAGTGDVILQATESGSLIFRTGGATGANTRITVDNAGLVGIGTTGPDAKLDSLATTEQLRLTYTDGTVYSAHTVDSSGNLTIDNTGTKTIIADDLQINGGDILDSNGNESIRFGTTASAVNEATLTNAATAGTVLFAATGGDTDVALSIDSKGADALNLNGTATGDILLGGGSGSTGCTLTNSTGEFTCTILTASSLKWNALTVPDGNLTLAMDADTTTFNWDTLTTGTGWTGASTSLSSGTLESLSVNSTAATGNTQKVLSLSTAGANANSTQTTYGLYSTNTHTGTASTNVGGYFSASGATNNYGLIVENGNVGIGTTAPGATLDVNGNINMGAYSALSWGSDTYSITGQGGGTTFQIKSWALPIIFVTSGGEAMRIVNGSGNVGIGTTGPDAKLDSLATTEQLRLTYTDGTVYSAHTVDSSGNLTIDNTGTKTIIADDLQINGGDILDSNGNESIRFGTTASAVNEATLTNAATAGTVLFAATGGDTDIALSIDSKGADALNLNGTATGDILLGGGSGSTGCTLTNSTGEFTCTILTASSLKWNALTVPDGNLTLAMDADTTTFNWDTLTTGTGWTGASTSLSSGTLESLSVNSTAATGNTQKVLSLSTAGANANSTQTTYGLYATNTHTGTASTNVGGYFSASGATNNYGLIVENGNVGIGTTTPNQQLEITQNFRLPATTYNSGNQYGIIYKDGNRFIHDFNYGNNGTVTTLGYNTLVGVNAGNLTMGSTATQTVEASYNTAVGNESLFSNTKGYRNNTLGYQSLYTNTTGYHNTAIGHQALKLNNTGNYNTALGASALDANTSSSNNTAVGSSALGANTGASSSNNTAVGSSALGANTSGQYNTSVGGDALSAIVGSYHYNTGFGYHAGTYLTGGSTTNQTSSTSLFLGALTKAYAASGSNEIVIGYDTTGFGSNTAAYGNSSMTGHIFQAGSVGIGTTGPSQKLTIQQDSVADLFGIYDGGNNTSMLLADGGTTTFKPSAFDKVFNFDGTVTYTDNTTEAKTIAGTPFTVLADNNDYFYIGLDHKFATGYFDIATALSGTGQALVSEYYNGSTWTTLSVTDNTTVFTTDGNITFTAPSDWATASVNSQTKYWVRFSITYSGLSTAPTAYSVSPTTGSRFYAYAQSGDSEPTFYINDQGRIGINNDTPDVNYKLDVTGQIGAQVFYDNDPVNKTSYGLDPAGTTNFGGYSLKITGGALLAYDSGNVGIGATSPGGKLDIKSTQTSGTLILGGAPSAVTLAGALTGINLDLSTNYTATGFDVTGQSISLPAVTNTGAGTYAYKGLTVTGGALIQNTGAGTDTWTGLDITMPAITQTTGSVISTGLKITGGTVTSGTSYGLIVDSNAGNVGIGDTTPSYLLEVYHATDDTVARFRSGDDKVRIQLQDNDTYGYIMAYDDYYSMGGQNTIHANNLNINATTGFAGLGTTGPDRRLDVLDASNPQLRLTQADGTVYTDFQMNSDGDLIMNVDGISNQLVLDNGGYVGIGTAAPIAPLQVGKISSTANVMVGDNSNATTDATNGINIMAYSSGSNYIDSKTITGGSTYFRTGEGTETGYARTWMTVDSTNGNVGIGTASPTQTLDVNGTITLRGAGGVMGATLFKWNNGNYIAQNSPVNFAETIFTGPSSNIAAMTWGADGNVGIGTTGPGAKLHVSGTAAGAALTTAILGNTDGTVGASARLYLSGNDVTSRSAYVEGINIETAGGNEHALTFGTSASGASPTEKMRIDNLGNVGIGTTTPSQLLDVAGNFKVSAGNTYQVAMNTSGTPTASLCWQSSNGLFVRKQSDACLASTQRVKHNIAPIDIDALDQILLLQPVTFVYNWDTDDKVQMGLIAEQVAAVNPLFADYDEEGLPSGLKSTAIMVATIDAIKEQQTQIVALQNAVGQFNLTPEGDLDITTQNNQYVVKDSGGKVFDKVAGFAKAAAGYIKAGVIETKQVIADSIEITSVNLKIGGKTITQFIDERIDSALENYNNSNIISPLANIETLNVSEKIKSPIVETENITVTDTAKINKIEANEIKPADRDLVINLNSDVETQNFASLPTDPNAGKLAKLIIKGLEGKTAVVIDAAGNASFSGQIIADSIVASSSSFLSSRIQDLSSNTASISGKLIAGEIESSTINDIQALLADIKNQPISDPTNYQNLDSSISYRQGNALSLQTESLIVTGNSNLYNVSVSNSLLVGTTIIDQNSIISLASELKLSALSTINLLDGAVIIARDGTITTQGEIIAQGGIRTNEIKALTDEGQVTINQLTTNQLSISDKYLKATDSASIIAAPDNFTQNGIFAPAIETATASAGLGILPEGSQEVLIYNSLITPDSLIYLTPISPISPITLSVGEKSSGAKSYFKVVTSTPSTLPIKFNWLIIN